jgi:hypothetical protein
MMAPMMSRVARAAPTPMPAWAAVERPEEEWAEELGVGIEDIDDRVKELDAETADIEDEVDAAVLACAAVADDDDDIVCPIDGRVKYGTRLFGAGARNVSSVGSWQWIPMVSSKPQQCQRPDVALYTMSGDAWSPTSCDNRIRMMLS